MEQAASRVVRTGKSRLAADPEAVASGPSSAKPVVNMRKSKPSIGIHDRGGRRFSDTKDPPSGTLSGGEKRLGHMYYSCYDLFVVGCMLLCLFLVGGRGLFSVQCLLLVFTNFFFHYEKIALHGIK